MKDARIRRLVILGVLLFIAAFSLFGLTASRLGGYEPETAAVAEGFARTGEFVLLEDSPLRSEGRVGKDGRLYGRVGLPQPLLEAPFYLAGDAVDSALAGEHYTYRKLALRLYNPFVAALSVVAIFGIVVVRRGSVRWGLAMAAMFAAASLTWPYSKIGMDTTLMWALTWFFLFACIAARSERVWPWVATGFMAGLAFAAKAYVAVVLLPALAILLPALHTQPLRGRLTRLAAAFLPVLAWGAAFAAYNLARFGTVTEPEESYDATISAPINFVGFFVSPGKGLLFYSPLAVLGLLALRRLWRADRPLAIAIAGCVVLGTAVGAGSNHWSDETWGPRYLVPVAWLLLLPIAWSARTHLQRLVIAAVATLGVTVQLVGVIAPYQTYAHIYDDLTGVQFLQPGRSQVTDAPFGRDPLRWVPQLSPLLVQGIVVASWVNEELGGRPIPLRYTPYEGQVNEVDLQDGAAVLGITLPDFWWSLPPEGREPPPTGWIAIVMALAFVASSAALIRSSRVPSAAAPPRMPAPTSGPADRLGLADRILARSRIRRLTDGLRDGETVLLIVVGEHRGAVCAAAVTGDAVLLSTGDGLMRLDAADVVAVKVERHALGARLQIVTPATVHEVTMIWPYEDAVRFAEESGRLSRPRARGRPSRP